MKQKRIIQIQKLQNKNRMVGQQFSTLASNEVRWTPVLGSAWFTGEEGEDEERNIFIENHRKRILNEIVQEEPFAHNKDSLSFYGKNNKVVIVLVHHTEHIEILKRLSIRKSA